MRGQDAAYLMKGFFRRSFWLALLLSLALSVLLPLLVYYMDVQRYKDDSLRLLDQFIRSDLNMDLRELLVESPATQEVKDKINAFMQLSDLVDIKIWAADTTNLYSYLDPSISGKQFTTNTELLETVREEKAEANIESEREIENEALRGYGDLLEVYVPVRRGSEVVGAVEVYRRAPAYRFLGPHLVFVAALCLVALMLLYLLLYGSFRKATDSLISYDHRLEAAYGSLGQSYFDTIRSLVNALELRDMETEGHSERVVTLSLHLGRKLGLGEVEVGRLVLGAYLHDVGKIGVPDTILLKPGRLTPEEREVMMTHVAKGHHIIKDVEILRDASDVVLYHHERWDGRGYPHGRAGRDIPVTARIFALVDVLDALMSKRPYKGPMSYAEALDIIVADSGSHFDPEVVEALRGTGEAELTEVLGGVSASGIAVAVREALGQFTMVRTKA